MTAAPSTRPAGDGGLAARIALRARDFDLPALLALLRSAFPDRTVRLRAHESVSPRRTLVESIDFAPGEIHVYVNAGLLSATSPLPSYFTELLVARSPDSGLHRLLAALNEILLAGRVEALDPERSPRLFSWAQGFRRGTLGLSGPASPSTLHWIFRSVFPELRVTVGRAALRARAPLAEVCLGDTPLGDGALGGEVEVPIAGFDVRLLADDPTSLDGRAWIVEGRRRIDALVLPALRFTGVALRVLLIELGPAPALGLRPETNLGFHPLASEGPPPHVSVLFDGRVGELTNLSETEEP